MAVLQMQRISICALKKDRKTILEKVQSMGMLEINSSVAEDEIFEKMDTMNARQSFEKKAQLADQALAVLDTYAPVKTSMLSGLQGKELVEKELFAKAVAEKEKIVAASNQLVGFNKEIAENGANVLKLQNQIEALTPWLALDVPINYGGTKQTAMLTGTMPGELTLEQIYAGIAEQKPELEAVDIHIISSDKDATYLTVFCLRQEDVTVEEALRAKGFARPSQMPEDIPGVVKQKLEAEIIQLNKKTDEIKSEIQSLSGKREELKMISDYFRSRAEKYGVLGALPQSQRTFVLSGYAPAKSVPALQKAIGERYDCVIDVEEISEDEEYPIQLKNNGFSSSMEGVLSAYGLPQRHEFDPTTIMSFFYVVFFGLMLSDAAYGLIIAVVCFILVKKFPRMSEGMHKSLKMFMFCGLSTLVWGILFGGYFGDIVDIVSQNYFGTKVTIQPLWFMPLNDPMKLLIWSMLFGTIHLFVGLGIKGYVLLRDKKIVDFFCDVVLWFIFLIGLIMMLLPSSIFASISQMEIVFSPGLTTLSKTLAIIGAVGLVLMSGRSSKNPVLRLALGAYDIYNITGWLSDVLSYSRLLALGLATGVIASVINQMGSMFGTSIVGTIAFIAVFIFGHIFNMGINILGAYVHTNRLQFVEFFGKFYEGGGKPFEPFHSNTKYVDVKEETL